MNRGDNFEEGWIRSMLNPRPVALVILASATSSEKWKRLVISEIAKEKAILLRG